MNCDDLNDKIEWIPNVFIVFNCAFFGSDSFLLICFRLSAVAYRFYL